MRSSRFSTVTVAAPARRAVLTYPHNLLRAACESVGDVSAPDVQRTASDLVAALVRAPALGLSAPQLGSTHRMFAMRRPLERLPPRPAGARRRREAAAVASRARPDVMVVVNPVIIRRSVRRVLQTEGCLSLPDLDEILVWRWAAVVVQYTDMHGDVQFDQFKGLPAAVFQHEADHLDGVLMPDREARTVPEEMGATSMEALRREANGRGQRELEAYYGTAWMRAFKE
jgi:peptide deformylase